MQKKSRGTRNSFPQKSGASKFVGPVPLNRLNIPINSVVLLLMRSIIYYMTQNMGVMLESTRTPTAYSLQEQLQDDGSKPRHHSENGENTWTKTHRS